MSHTNRKIRLNAIKILGKWVILPDPILHELLDILPQKKRKIGASVLQAIRDQKQLSLTILFRVAALFQTGKEKNINDAADILIEHENLPEPVIQKLLDLLYSVSNVSGINFSLRLDRLTKRQNQDELGNIIKIKICHILRRQHILPLESHQKLAVLLEDECSDVREAAAAALSTQNDLEPAITRQLAILLFDYTMTNHAPADALGKQRNLPFDVLEVIGQLYTLLFPERFRTSESADYIYSMIMGLSIVYLAEQIYLNLHNQKTYLFYILYIKCLKENIAIYFNDDGELCLGKEILRYIFNEKQKYLFIGKLHEMTKDIKQNYSLIPFLTEPNTLISNEALLISTSPVPTRDNYRKESKPAIPMQTDVAAYPNALANNKLIKGYLHGQLLMLSAREDTKPLLDGSSNDPLMLWDRIDVIQLLINKGHESENIRRKVAMEMIEHYKLRLLPQEIIVKYPKFSVFENSMVKIEEEKAEVLEMVLNNVDPEKKILMHRSFEEVMAYLSDQLLKMNRSLCKEWIYFRNYYYNMWMLTLIHKEKVDQFIEFCANKLIFEEFVKEYLSHNREYIPTISNINSNRRYFLFDAICQSLLATAATCIWEFDTEREDHAKIVYPDNKQELSDLGLLLKQGTAITHILHHKSSVIQLKLTNKLGLEVSEKVTQPSSKSSASSAIGIINAANSLLHFKRGSHDIPIDDRGIQSKAKRRDSNRKQTDLSTPSSNDHLKDKAYFITSGFGNCFIHAAFGVLFNEIYQVENPLTYRHEMVKFLKKFSGLDDPSMPLILRERLETVFSMFFETTGLHAVGENEDAFVINIRGIVAKKIDEAHKKTQSLVEEINDAIIENTSIQAKNILRALVNNIARHNEINEHYRIIRIQLLQSIQDLNLISDEELVYIARVLSKHSKYLHDKIFSDLEVYAKIFKQSELLKHRVFFKSVCPREIIKEFTYNCNLYNLYLEQIIKQQYYIYFEEIPIWSALSGRQINVWYHDGGQITCQQFLPNNEITHWKNQFFPERSQVLFSEIVPVAIYHEGFMGSGLRGNHFSRANESVLLSMVTEKRNAGSAAMKQISSPVI